MIYPDGSKVGDRVRAYRHTDPSMKVTVTTNRAETTYNRITHFKSYGGDTPCLSLYRCCLWSRRLYKAVPHRLYIHSSRMADLHTEGNLVFENLSSPGFPFYIGGQSISIIPIYDERNCSPDLWKCIGGSFSSDVIVATWGE